VTNAYDAAGNRVGIAYGTNLVAYVVNPNAKLSQVLMRVKNGVTNYYIYGAGLLYQVTEFATVTNTLTYHYDCRGSTVAITDGTGTNVTDQIEYSAYATTTYRSGTNDTPFLFNGRYGVMTDPNGLLYMKARYYNPFVCRFINPDPSGFSGGLNFYAFADGNPISLIDPFGLWTWGQVGSFGLHFVEGVVVGAAITAAVIVAAPVVAAVSADLIVGYAAAYGVEVSAATAGTYAVAAVDTGLLFGGSAGVVSTAANTGVNISQGNWDAVAFNAGNLLGGYGVGVNPFLGSSSGGRLLADSLTGISDGTIGFSDGGASPAPEFSAFNLPGAASYEYANRLTSPFGESSDLLGWSASAPTPFSGGFSATFTGALPGAVNNLTQQVTGQTAVDWLGNTVQNFGTSSH
jgi:RHS repeat-associated protein